MATTLKRLIDSREVERAYQLLVTPGQVVEVRALNATIQQGSRYTDTLSGYFDNLADLIKAISTIRAAQGIYITLQPCHQDLLDRAENKLIKQKKGYSTSDEDIIRYAWLPIDCDPERKSGISSTDSEHEQALTLSRRIRNELLQRGWPTPVLADSGNGAHLHYKIDLATTDNDLVKRVLEGLAELFDAPGIHVDKTLFNPSRIIKLYGTLACKGDDTNRRPHRMSRLLEVPEQLQIVPRELLEEIATQVPITQPLATYRVSSNGSRPQERIKEDFTAEKFLQKHNIAVKSSGPYQGGMRYLLETCVWNPSHTDNSACVYRFADGKLGASCSHNSCYGKGWKAFRAVFEPDAYNKKEPQGAGTEQLDNGATIEKTICEIPGIDRALKDRDPNALYSHAAAIASLPDLALKHLRLAIRSIFGRDFPMREFDDLLQVERQGLDQQKRQPEVKSVRDLMKVEFPKVDWVVPEILPQGLIALAGKQKIGKSWLDYLLALGVASGGQVLGKKVERGDVLYLALEDTDRRLQQRFRKLLAPNESIPDGLEYETKWPRMDTVGIAALEAWIKAHPNARLIIIDPWVKVKPRIKNRAGETGYDADYEALEGLKRLADTYRLCILVQFHLRKASAEDPFDELNGTSGITACADGFLSLKRGRGESDATLWGTGRDYVADVNLALSFKEGLWTELGPADKYAHSKASKEVLDILKDKNKPLQPKEIALLLDKPDGTIRRLLFNMKKRDEVQETNAGYIPNKNANYGNGGNGGNASSVNQPPATSEDTTTTVTEGVTDGNAVTPPTQNEPLPLPRYRSDVETVTALDEPEKPDKPSTVTAVTVICKKHAEQQAETLSETATGSKPVLKVLRSRSNRGKSQEQVMGESEEAVISLSTPPTNMSRCETRFNLQLSDNHKPGETLTTDALGNLWCEQCHAQRTLMDLGYERGWPEMVLNMNGKKAKLRAGQDEYLKFARTAGHRLVSIALQHLDEHREVHARHGGGVA